MRKILQIYIVKMHITATESSSDEFVEDELMDLTFVKNKNYKEKLIFR